MNKQVYDTAYKRAVEGKAPRTLWETVLSPFEDVETRMSREAGEREGKAARAKQEAAPEPQVQQN
ncbi:MAG: hypothetical protein AB1941_19975 [Gemmatimonadota bacterium]